MRARCRWLGRTVAFVVYMALAGCTSGPSSTGPMPDEVRATLEAVSVHRLAFGDNFGTGVHIGGNRILTCRHVIQDGNSVRVDGRFAIFEILAAGPWDGEGDSVDDWAIIQLLAIEIDGPSVMALWRGDQDPGHADVLFKTYFYSGPMTDAEAYATPITWMQGRLVPAPDEDNTRALLYTEISDPAPEGGSGGPMFSFDPVTNDVALRGIYVRAARVHFLGIPLREMLIACAITDEAADALETYGVYD